VKNLLNRILCVVGLHDWGFICFVRLCNRHGCTCTQTYREDRQRWVSL